jgi:hypothetical protein
VIPILAHQDLAQLRSLGAEIESIPKAARHFFCFAVTGDDAPYAAREFHPTPAKLDLPLSVTPLADAAKRLPDARILDVVHRIERLANQATVSAEIEIEEKGRRLRQSAWREYLTRLENAVNRLLFIAMSNHDGEVDDDAYHEVVSASFAVFSYSASLRDSYLGAVKELAQILSDNPVYQTGKDDTESETQAQRTLQRRLTGLNTFHAYCKVNQHAVVTEQFVVMEPLPRVNVVDAAVLEKRSRIGEGMRTRGIVWPRTRGAQNQEQRPRQAQSEPEEPAVPPPSEKPSTKRRRSRWENL